MLSVPHPFIYESVTPGPVDTTGAEGTSDTLRVEKLSATSATGATSREKTVLIVDDDPAVCTTAALILESQGFKVLTAPNGLEALDMMHGNPQIGAVVLDLLMPVMDGEETFRQLRQFWSNIPVIVISGFSSGEIARRFPTPAPEGFVQKPFTFESLLVALSRVVA